MNLIRIQPPHIFRAQALLLLIASLFAPTLGWAQQSLEEQALEQQNLARAQSGWNVTLGGALVSAPRFPGASKRRLRLRPLFAIHYGDRLIIGPLGIGVVAVRWKGFRAGPVLGYQRSRRRTDDPALAALGDVPSSVTAGLFAGYARGPIAASVTARQAISHSADGLSGLLRVDLRHVFIVSRNFVTVGPDLEFGNGDFERTWFGVSPTQSVDSGLPVYEPRAGINRIGLHGSLTHRATRHVLLRAFARVSRLAGGAGRSPIVERRGQVELGVGFAYNF